MKKYALFLTLLFVCSTCASEPKPGGSKDSGESKKEESVGDFLGPLVAMFAKAFQANHDQQRSDLAQVAGPIVRPTTPRPLRKSSKKSSTEPKLSSVTEE